jgi:hypothetical protein
MLADQQQLVEILKRQCTKAPARYRKYHEDILDTLGQVLLVERANRTAPGNIVQQIEGKCEALAELVLRADKTKGEA